jgi:hypothetical protein
LTVPAKIVRKLALYQGQLRSAALSIPAGFILAAAGGADLAIQKDLTKSTGNIERTRRAPPKRKTLFHAAINTRYFNPKSARKPIPEEVLPIKDRHILSVEVTSWI